MHIDNAWAMLQKTSAMREACFSCRNIVCICRSEGEGFPGVDYNDVYKISQAFAHEHDNEDLLDAEMASLGSISVSGADLEAADFEAASEDSVF